MLDNHNSSSRRKTPLPENERRFRSNALLFPEQGLRGIILDGNSSFQ